MQLDGFLGLASYYRWFTADFSIIAKPLYRLSKKGETFLWALKGEWCSKAEALPHKFPSSRLPRLLTWRTDLHTGHWLGISAVLSQVQSDGTEKVKTYGSHSLNDHKTNYCTTQHILTQMQCLKSRSIFMLTVRPSCTQNGPLQTRVSRYHEGTGSKPRWSPDFFRQLLKLRS